MRATELLSIDVAAELRTICGEQLHGLWQLPVELIRFAVSRGAAAAELTTSGRGFVIRCPGTAAIREQLERLAVALDPGGSDEGRHEAVVELERHGAHALLWAGGVPGVALKIASRSGRSATVFEQRPDRRPRLVVDAPDEVLGGFEVDLQAADIDVRRATAWVDRATRFAPIAVTVDGREVTQGFGDNLYSVSLGSPLAGGIALTLRGDAPHLWLLRYGIVAARATLSDHFPFEAALELADVTPANANPEELRAAVASHLPLLVDRASRLLVDALSDRVEEDSVRAERLATLVLRAASTGLRAQEIARLEAFAAVDRATGVSRPMSLADIRAMKEGGIDLWSVPPGTDTRRIPADERALLVLNDEQHGLLVELIGVSIQRPEPRDLLGRRRFSWPRFRADLDHAGARLTGFAAPRVLADSQLLTEELRLIRELERIAVDVEGRPLKARICAGTGRIRFRNGELLLPRHQPLVVHVVRLVDRGEEWLYPACLALVGEHGRVSPELRSRWRRVAYSRPPAQPPGQESKV